MFAPWHQAILGAVRDRGPGVRITDALVALLAASRIPDGDGWTTLFAPERFAGFRRFLTVWHESPALQGRYLSSNERLQERLVPLLAGELGLPEGDDELQIFAGMLVAAMHRRMVTLSRMVLAGAPPEATRERVVAATALAFARVAIAFPDLDRPGRGTAARR